MGVVYGCCTIGFMGITLVMEDQKDKHMQDDTDTGECIEFRVKD